MQATYSQLIFGYIRDSIRLLRLAINSNMIRRCYRKPRNDEDR